MTTDQYVELINILKVHFSFSASCISIASDSIPNQTMADKQNQREKYDENWCNECMFLFYNYDFLDIA